MSFYPLKVKDADINLYRKSLGRPPIFKNPEAMLDKFMRYVKECAENDIMLRITAVALGLGFNSIGTFYEYEKKPEFSEAMLKIRTVVEDSALKRMFAVKNPIPIMYYLKAYFGRVETRKYEQTIESRSIGMVKIMLEDNRKEVKAEIEDELQNKE